VPRTELAARSQIGPRGPFADVDTVRIRGHYWIDGCS
jgi:hypothetical protein